MLFGGFPLNHQVDPRDRHSAMQQTHLGAYPFHLMSAFQLHETRQWLIRRPRDLVFQPLA